MDGKTLGNYVIFDDKLMVLEQNQNFPEELLGDIGSMAYHINKAIDENQILLDVQFEKSNITLMKNKELKTAICSFNKKK